MLHPSSSGFLKQLRNAAWQRPANAIHPRSLVSRLVLILSVLGGVCFGAGIVPRSAFAASVTPQCTNSNNQTVLCWDGGKVQHDPHVYLVFWGPKWQNDSVHEQIVRALEIVFDDLAGRQYTNILTQYGDSLTDPSSGFHNDTDDATHVGYDLSTPSADLNPLDAVGAAQDTAAYQNWPINNNSQFLVFPQEGTTYSAFGSHDYCGMHADNTGGTIFGLIRYASDVSGCDFVDGAVSTYPDNLVDDMVWTAIHEFTEIVTDPRFIVPLEDTPAWKTDYSSSLDPTEVADLCQTRLPDASTPKTTFRSFLGSYQAYLPYLWSNSANNCVLAAGQEFPSPDTTLPFNGRHTVQNPVLAVYQQYGADTGLLGQPLSEMTPVAGGWVSYFQGTSCSGSTYGAIYAGGGGTHEVHGCIDQKYQNLGGPTSYLGFPTSDQQSITGGYVNYFQGTACGSQTYGAIYYAGATGGNSVHGCIDQKYQSLGGSGSFLGFPTSDEGAVTGGHYSYFQGTSCSGSTYGAIYAGGGGTHEVHGCIDREYSVTMGGPGGLLGFPVADETSIAGGRVSYFAGQVCNGGYVITDENGTSRTSGSAIYHDATAGNHEVHGCIYNLYTGGMGGPGGSMGFPVSDEQDAVNGGRVSYFAGHGCSTGNGPYSSGSAIYYDAGDTYFVWGCIYARYQATCQEISAPCVNLLGLPTSDEIALTGGHVSYFQGTSCSGSTYGAVYSSGAGVYEVHGCIDKKYQSLGGSASYLGFPTSDEIALTGGHVTYFEGSSCGGSTYGAIYSSASGSYAVHGCIDQKYESLSGPNSNLGFPVSDEYTNSAGHRESDFVGGSIVYANGAAVVTLNCVGLGTCV